MTSLKKYTSHFIERLCVRESWRLNKDCNILTSTLMAISVVSFSFSWWSTGGPGAQLSAECWLSLLHLVTNGSGLQTNWLPVFTELYNSSIAHSISLEWHVWSSSSEKNCHAVHRSLSSGASVYDYEILLCPILSVKPAYAISSHNCHRNVSLPSGESLRNGMFGRVEDQYTTSVLHSI